MTLQVRPRAGFVSGWREVAVNLLSGSVALMALSSAIAGASGAQVVEQAPSAAGVRVQLADVPVSVAWPRAAATTFLELHVSASGSRSAVLEGLQRGVVVELCSTAWTPAGTCSGARREVVGAGGGDVISLAPDAPVAHLKVMAVGGAAPAGSLVLRTAA